MAAVTAPAVPLPAMASAEAVVVPKAARFWAIYMTHLHGDVTPGMLTQMTGIDPSQTTAIRAKLVADKVISPTGFIRKSLASQTFARSQQQTQDTLARIKTQAEKATELVDEISEPSTNPALDETDEADEPKETPTEVSETSDETETSDPQTDAEG